MRNRYDAIALMGPPGWVKSSRPASGRPESSFGSRTGSVQLTLGVICRHTWVPGSGLVSAVASRLTPIRWAALTQSSMTELSLIRHCEAVGQEPAHQPWSEASRRTGAQSRRIAHRTRCRKSVPTFTADERHSICNLEPRSGGCARCCEAWRSARRGRHARPLAFAASSLVRQKLQL